MNNNQNTFELWPAIDLMNGGPVRLTKGDFEAQSQYALSFNDIVAQFETFASGIHIIDLDGAKSGVLTNTKAVSDIMNLATLPVQLGGGISTFECLNEWMTVGINRAIIGTKALTDPDLLARFITNFGVDKIMISVDVKQGKVMTKGWTESNEIGAFEFIESLIQKGIYKFMVTDIEQDGTLQGASNDLYRALKNKFPNIYLLAAGGVGCIGDLQDLKATGISGAIFGKAFYEGKISIEELNQFNNAG
jgi:phosphoribosylformimino-5-aminoimidazole carboxamide ribotide isomerase